MNSEILQDDLASKVLEQEEKNKRALAILLDKELANSKRILVQRTVMGGTESYVGSVSLQWFAERVGFASELPLFKQKVDPKTGKVMIDEETISEIQQRPLDWSREAALAQYLAVLRTHKFPAVLVVLNRPWVDDLQADEWNREKRAVKSVADFIPLDNEGRVGVLDVSEGVTIYALDGQHRLMGVRALMQLLRTGRLPRKNKDGKASSEMILIEDLEKKYKLDHARLQTLPAERIGIEFIAGVIPGENREEARRRVRSIFVHVNRMAAKLTPGQLAVLDEDDGFSIVARRAAVFHELLKKKDGKARVNWDSSTISLRSTVITTLQTLKEMTKAFLEHNYGHWNPSQTGLVQMRPEDAELDEGEAQFNRFLDGLASLPVFKRIESGSDITKIRRFEIEDGGEGHMLLRPVGQVALAQAMGVLVFGPRKMSLEAAFKKLSKFDEQGGFRIDTPKSLFYMVLYDPAKERMLVSGRDLAARLLEYMVGGGIEDEQKREALRKELIDHRTIENETRGFDGKTVSVEKAESKIELPKPL